MYLGGGGRTVLSLVVGPLQRDNKDFAFSMGLSTRRPNWAYRASFVAKGRQL